MFVDEKRNVVAIFTTGGLKAATLQCVQQGPVVLISFDDRPRIRVDKFRDALYVSRAQGDQQRYTLPPGSAEVLRKWASDPQVVVDFDAKLADLIRTLSPADKRD